MKLKLRINIENAVVAIGNIGIGGIALYQILLRDMFGFPSFFQYICSALCAITIIYTVSIGKFNFRQKEFICLLCFHLYMLFAAVFSPDIGRSLSYWINYSLDYIVFFCIIALIGLKRDLKLLFCIIAIGAAIVIYFMLFMPSFRYGNARLRLAANQNPNYLGLIFAFGVWMFCYVSKLNIKSLIINSVVGFFAASAIIMTGSRKSLIVLIAVFALYLLNYFSNAKTRTKIIMILLLCGLGVYAFRLLYATFLDSYIASRFSSSFESATDQVRISMYKNGLSLFLKNPIFGIGYQGYYLYYGITYSHSTYIEVLVNGGIIGTMVYFSAFVIAFKRLINHMIILKRFDRYENEIAGAEEIKNLRYRDSMLILMLALFIFLATMLVYLYTTLYLIYIYAALAESYVLENRIGMLNSEHAIVSERIALHNENK